MTNRIVRKQLRVWAFGDAHVAAGKRFENRDSLGEAIFQSESGGPDGITGFEWDLGLDVGDMCGNAGVPQDDEGQEIVRQFGALRHHKREDIYSVCGNHDRSGLDEPEAWWWQKWIDPMGQHTSYSGVDSARRPYPIEGTWDRYSFRVGNILFLMMSDRNEPTQKVGRGTHDGNPGGVVSGETFAWWKEMVESNSDSIIVSAHHYVLKNTTVASGEWEGWRYHQYYFPEGTPRGASYLYWVNSIPDAQAFERYLEAHPGAVQLWLGGHTHTHPDDIRGGKSHIEQKWGTYFLNVAALTRYRPEMVPMSRLLTFTEGSHAVQVQCYLHTNHHAPQGWYPKAEETLQLLKTFHWS